MSLPARVLSLLVCGCVVYRAADLGSARQHPNSREPSRATESTILGRLQLGPAATTTLALVFEGASNDVAILGVGKRPGVHNYFVGNDPSAWQSHVPTYSGVLYRGMYEGVDVRVREGAERFEPRGQGRTDFNQTTLACLALAGRDFDMALYPPQIGPI